MWLLLFKFNEFNYPDFKILYIIIGCSIYEVFNSINSIQYHKVSYDNLAECRQIADKSPCIGNFDHCLMLINIVCCADAEILSI